MNVELTGQLLLALKATFVADSSKLKQTTAFLQSAAKQSGFCVHMMEIIDNVENPMEIRQAALIQLKNTIKQRWYATQGEMERAEKQVIKSALLLAFVRGVKWPQFVKLYKDILKTVIGHEFKDWMPVSIIADHIRNNHEIIPILHAMIAIVCSFQFGVTEDEKKCLCEFLSVTMPQLHSLVMKNQQPEFMYLCIKFVWKTVHYQINDQVKLLTVDWMPLIQAVLALDNPEFYNKAEDTQIKGTPQFYYFHSKKWATRIFLRFVQKHAKIMVINKVQRNREFATKWYKAFGESFITGLIGQFRVPAPTKLRFFQLKCVHSLAVEKPNEMKQFGEAFQETVLLPYLKLQPKDQQLANSDPIQFLNKEDEPSMNYTNLKRVAIDVWVTYAQLGSKPKKRTKPHQPGVFFFKNMHFLQSKLKSTDQIEKEMAMYIICQLQSSITRCSQVKEMLPTLIAKYVIPQFKNQIMFLRARAMQVFRMFGMLDFPRNVVELAVQGIYTCLTKDSSPLVRIKAAAAFTCIIQHKSAKDLVRPLLKDILTVYIQLVDHYDTQNVVNSLESIVEDFDKEIGPFALDLVKYLSKLFNKLFNKDIEKATEDNDYEGDAELAAASCLKTITQIIQAPINQQTIMALEPQVLLLCEFIFTVDGQDYIDDALFLLNAFLFKIQNISPRVWFFYQVVVYNIVGIPKEMWSIIDKLPVGEKDKKIFLAIKEGNNLQVMEQSMPVIRNYIRKGSSIIMDNQDAFKTNLLHLLFYLINTVYTKGPSEINGELEMDCCTALLIYLLQNYQKSLPQEIYKYIWRTAKLNCTNAKSKTLKTLNSQLLGMLAWTAADKIIPIVYSEQMLPLYLKQMLSYEDKYEQDHERVRLTLGLNALLVYADKPQQLMVKIPEIFKLLIKLINKNADFRLDEEDDTTQEKLKIMDEDEDFQNFSLDDDDDDDFWDEAYDDNYCSLLDDVDEISDFKNCIKKLAVEQPVFYQQLLKLVPAEQLAHLQGKMTRAIQRVSGPQ